MTQQGTRVAIASGAQTATGNSAAIRLGDFGASLGLLVDVTAVSGTTPSMTLTVEWSHDATAWAQGDPADTFTAITAASKKVKAFTVKAPYYRVVWTITGTTPSFTFSVGEHVV